MCRHEFEWIDNYPKSTADGIRFPVKCKKCGLEGYEYYLWSSVVDDNGNVVM